MSAGAEKNDSRLRPEKSSIGVTGPGFDSPHLHPCGDGPPPSRVLAVVFHLLLAPFGPGTWVWCVPALALLAWGLRRDWSRLVPAPG